MLNRLVFTVLNPCLLFTVTFRADLGSVLSSGALVAVLSAAAAMATFAVTARLCWGRPFAGATIPALAAGYTNVGYIGIPVATYVLGNAAAVLPVLLLQLLVITPLALLTLDLRGHGGSSWSALLVPLRNPLVLAILAGVGDVVPGPEPARRRPLRPRGARPGRRAGDPDRVRHRPDRPAGALARQRLAGRPFSLPRSRWR